jgi:hypothetical protein
MGRTVEGITTVFAAAATLAAEFCVSAWGKEPEAVPAEHPVWLRSARAQAPAKNVIRTSIPSRKSEVCLCYRLQLPLEPVTWIMKLTES